MIQSITVTDHAMLPIEWGERVSWLQDRHITFSPGINVIVGPNGSGKSSFLKVLARYFHCEQGGYSRVTQESIEKLIQKEKGWYWQYPIRNGASIEHDGQIMFYTGDHEVGLEDGIWGMDFTFFAEGKKHCEPVSSGERSLRKFDYVKGLLTKHAVFNPKHAYADPNDSFHKKYLNSLQVIHNPTLPVGKRTILMDEPDENLDLRQQILFFKEVQELAKEYQIILSAHSPFAIQLSNVHVIETEEGYYEDARQQMRELF